MNQKKINATKLLQDMLNELGKEVAGDKWQEQYFDPETAYLSNMLEWIQNLRDERTNQMNMDCNCNPRPTSDEMTATGTPTDNLMIQIKALEGEIDETRQKLLALHDQLWGQRLKTRIAEAKQTIAETQLSLDRAERMLAKHKEGKE